MKNGKVKHSRTSSGKVFGCGVAEPYGDRARRREGFEPHDLRVIASRPSSSRVVLRARQAALPKLALWKTPLAKTPCPWRFDFANPTSHARRSHNPTKEKNSPMGCFSFVCIAPLKKISLSNPAGITEHLPFSGLPHSTRPLYPRNQLSFCYVFLPTVNFIYPGNASLFCDIIVPKAGGDLLFSL